jgi:hypothetical protein
MKGNCTIAQIVIVAESGPVKTAMHENRCIIIPDFQDRVETAVLEEK